MAEFRNIFEEDVELPEIVLAKADEAFNKIRAEERSAEPKKVSLKKRLFRNQAAAAAAIVCALILGGGAVYAACSHFGLLDFNDRRRLQLPQEAEKLISTADDQEPVSEASEPAIMDCQVKEVLCDSETINILFEISAKEKNKYLFVPTDALPEDHMSDWSDIEDRTAAEYASEKGLTIVNIGGGIANSEELGIFESALDFRSVSDDVMDIYIRSGKSSDAKNLEVSCIATAVIPGTDNVMRKTVKFTLEDHSASEITVYAPGETTGENVPYTIQKAEVIQTDLGTYIDVFYTAEDSAADGGPGLMFRILDENGAELEFVDGSGEELLEDGSRKIRIIVNKTEIGESFTVEGYGIFSEKELYGKTTMKKG